MSALDIATRQCFANIDLQQCSVAVHSIISWSRRTCIDVMTKNGAAQERRFR
jgi:hypothetical protein